MKLNLLPTYVSKEHQGRGAWFIFAVLAIVGVILAILMDVTSSQALTAAKQREAEARVGADAAKAESDKADAVMALPASQDIVRNRALAAEMLAHNGVYPALYDKVRNYIPNYFRVTSMSAAPNADGLTSVVTLTGVLNSYQQYADLMLALFRIPGAMSVSRSGYQLTDAYVPALTPVDSTGRPIKPGDANIPDKPYDRLQYLMNKGVVTGYLGVSGYGDQEAPGAKGPMPNASTVTVQVTIPGNLMTPDPRATLSAGAATTTAATTGAAGAFNPPTGAPTAPPAAAPATTTPKATGRQAKINAALGEGD